MKNTTYSMFAFGLGLVLAACGAEAVIDARSPLPTGCKYEEPNHDDRTKDLAYTCTGEGESAVAICQDGAAPYALARCTPHPKVAGDFCCPISVWPRDGAGNLLPPPDGMGGGGSGGAGSTSSSASSSSSSGVLVDDAGAP